MDSIRIERRTEQHINTLATLYSDPAVACQLLQMPRQAADSWCKRLDLDDERRTTLMAMHHGQGVAA